MNYFSDIMLVDHSNVLKGRGEFLKWVERGINFRVLGLPKYVQNYFQSKKGERVEKYFQTLVLVKL